MPRKAVSDTKSWWETVPGLLTGVSALIGAMTAALVAYANFPSTAARALQERYLAIESVDVPESSDIYAFFISAEAVIMGRIWHFPFPQGGSGETLPVGGLGGVTPFPFVFDKRFIYTTKKFDRQIYPLPTNTDGAAVSFNMFYISKHDSPNSGMVTAAFRGQSNFLKVPSSAEVIIHPISCKPFGAPGCVNPLTDGTAASDRNLATIHFSLMDRLQ
jgi:hypothetical protein